MFQDQVYRTRRAELKKKVAEGIILLMGNNESPMNYRHNDYPFRQDSSFLYYAGVDQPQFALVMNLETGEDILFGYEYTIDDIIWMGPQPTLEEWASKCGVEKYKPISELAAYIQKHKAPLHHLPFYRDDHIIFMAETLSLSIQEIRESYSERLIRSIISMRSIKEDREVVQMEDALEATYGMHTAVMQQAAEGMRESRLAGLAEGIAIGYGGRLSYPVILSRDGQTLHNHDHDNFLQKGDLVLGDFGAENKMHYAGDITRTFPINASFDERQKDIYQIVLNSQLRAIEMLQPGVTYLSVHMEAAKVMAKGLMDLGIMKGDVDEAVQSGAHALFFPHGLGHMIGLDVHDMENLGEDLVGYDDEIKRSTQFGTAFLRFGKKLQAGHVLTVEPGLYFIPELIEQWRSEKKYMDFIQYDQLDSWLDFGGVRIEDNILITTKDHRILGKPIPKTIEAIMALRKT